MGKNENTNSISPRVRLFQDISNPLFEIQFCNVFRLQLKLHQHFRCGEPLFWNIVLTGQHAEPRTKAMLEAKGIITWLPLAPVRRRWRRILKEIHTPVIPRCVFVYISNEERNTLQKSYRLLQPEVILQELPDRCHQNK